MQFGHDGVGPIDRCHDHHEVHGLSAEGPFIGPRDDRFAVRFVLDVTPRGGARMQMTEVALHDVRDGRIVQEAFLYLSD
ncbi:MAG: SnoaL-like domain-containing protein [Pseudomonadales bacterium]|nr:SnoaL-like domain-containing protein [Pseudomonadales bacterium]